MVADPASCEISGDVANAAPGVRETVPILTSLAGAMASAPSARYRAGSERNRSMQCRLQK